MTIVTIICGGNGTRLWPLSRKKLPKQFLKLVNNKTMFQNTILRFQTLQVSQFIVICNIEHQFIVEEQVNELNLNSEVMIVTESIGRDTGPAVAIASLLGAPDALNLIVPCDHIFNDEECCKIINIGLQEKYSEYGIVTFGISPTYPETGYGYIHTDSSYNTISFKEKPDQITAETYIKKGNYYWNAGLFLFKNKNMISCFEKYNTEILESCKETILNSKKIGNILQLNKKYFEKCPSISVDYSIMEPLTNDKNFEIQAFTIPYFNKWSDIGSFKSLYEECNKDENQNVKKGDVITYDTKNCYIESDKATVATVGLENLVIINTRDALLVSHKDKSQDVKKVLEKFNKTHEDLKVVHAKAYRPWGWYINIEGNDHSGYKVKRIGVYPGKRLSLQSHNNRSEHWVVTKGKARVQLNEEIIEMGPNDHVYIPVTALHRMENIGNEMVEFVETQIGDYLGEDDIVRYEDDFGRA